MTGARWYLVVVLIAFAGAAVDIWSLGQTSATYDEFGHLRYGLRVLEGDTSRFDDSKMPVSALNALAVRMDECFRDEPPRGLNLVPGRIVTVGAGVVLVVVISLWSRDLFGARSGLFAALLAAMEPNLHAHSRLVTTDVWSALAVTLNLWALWSWRRNPSLGRAALLGVSAGAALLTKFSAILLLPLILCGVFIAGSRCRNGFPRPSHRLLHLTIAAIAAISVLNLGYLGQGSLTPISAYQFNDSRMIAMASSLGPLADLPLPLPTAFVEGLDMVAYNEATGSGRGPAYLLGGTRHGRFATYYPLVFLLKVPLPLWILLAIACFHLWRREPPAPDLFPLLGGLVIFGGYFTLICRAQMGLRLALMVIPLLVVSASSVFRDRHRLRPARPLLEILLLSWMGVSVASFQPHLLPYVNELIPDRKMIWRTLADSNLDWGQAEIALKEFLLHRPGALVNPPIPAEGTIVVSANVLTGVLPMGDHRWYRWLAHERRPEAHIAYAYLIFEIDKEDLSEFNSWQG